MRIAIDWTPAVRQQAGIGRFTRDLIRALLESDHQHEFSLVVARDAFPESVPSNARIVRLPMSERLANILWFRLNLPVPITRFTGPIDLFHGTNFLLPPVGATPSVVTVHDLTFRVHPEFAEPSLARFLERSLPSTLRRATAICADSSATKSDLVRLMGVDSKRITVIHGAAAEQFVPLQNSPALVRVQARYPLDRPFLLALGTREPRKNLAGLLDAYAIVRARGLAPRLLIAGPSGWREQGFARKLAESEYQDDVVSLGFVAEDDLPALLRLTSCFVYPSFYEGFGLPALEALACGAPVVASDRSSLPEIAGDAAFLVSPDQPESIADAICRILSEPALAEHLRSAGPVQARAFSWAESARRLRQVYDQAARSA